MTTSGLKEELTGLGVKWSVTTHHEDSFYGRYKVSTHTYPYLVMCYDDDIDKALQSAIDYVKKAKAEGDSQE